MFVRIMTATIIFLAFIITLCPSAHSQSSFKCGKEFRIETQDGITFQGKLLANDGNLLALRHKTSGLHTIELGDVASAYSVKRRTGTGILIGSLVGIGVGFMVGLEIDQYGNYQMLPPANFMLQMVSLGIFGGFMGGIIGHSIQRLGPVQLEALPICLSPSGDIIPLKVNFAINF